MSKDSNAYLEFSFSQIVTLSHQPLHHKDSVLKLTE